MVKSHWLLQSVNRVFALTLTVEHVLEAAHSQTLLPRRPGKLSTRVLWRLARFEYAPIRSSVPRSTLENADWDAQSFEGQSGACQLRIGWSVPVARPLRQGSRNLIPRKKSLLQ